MKDLIKKNKFTIVFLIIVFILFMYCALQGFTINDDLPYSFFYRGNERVTTIKQIILNQMSDYLTINGRFFVHCVVQFVLMFNRNLFSILNSICLIITFIFTKKSVDLVLKKIKYPKYLKDVFAFCLIVSMFLLMGNLKYLVYWVAGSVNYIWIYCLLSIFIYYYLKTDLKKHKIFNCFIILIFSALHECSFVFILFVIIGDFIKKCIEGEKHKTINVIYLIVSVLGGLFVIMAPGNAARMATSPAFYDLSLIEKLNLTLPIISKKTFNILNYDNLVPTIYLLLFGIVLLLDKKYIFKYLGILLLFIICVTHILGFGWLYFVLSVVVFILSLLYNYKNKCNVMSVLLLAIYAVVFSMAITPEFGVGRPNYYLYLFMILSSILYLNIILKNKISLFAIEVISVIFVIFMMCFEINIYYNIGKIQKERLKQINYVKKFHLKTLKYKKIDEKYAKYHADANCPDSKDYWAYRYFVNYYNLPENIEIELID